MSGRRNGTMQQSQLYYTPVKRSAEDAEIKGPSPDSKIPKLDSKPEETIRVLKDNLEEALHTIASVKGMLKNMKNHRDMEAIFQFLGVKPTKELKLEVKDKPLLSKIKIDEKENRSFVNETIIITNVEMKEVKMEVLEEKLIKSGLTGSAKVTPRETEKKMHIHFKSKVDAYKCFKNSKDWSMKRWKIEFYQGEKIQIKKFDKDFANEATAKFAGVPRSSLVSFIKDIDRPLSEVRTSKLDDGKSKFLDIWVRFDSENKAIEMILDKRWESCGIKTRLFSVDDGGGEGKN